MGEISGTFTAVSMLLICCSVLFLGVLAFEHAFDLLENLPCLLAVELVDQTCELLLSLLIGKLLRFIRIICVILGQSEKSRLAHLDKRLILPILRVKEVQIAWKRNVPLCVR